MKIGNRTWALDVTDDGTGGVVHELDSDLSNTSTGTYRPSEPLLFNETLHCRGIALER